ncbi:hypothetical protein [Catenuloplanes atrovinosus]|uniref:Glycosyltransferase RgtA/B/C/D-like domain-containing protein n=1 Tax=Catenuloplanes atrovinosus TaxID=137266 RepID=A0AAE4CCM1_9ACTN|nr:hypothetical protein [Catenuloplanes atrovinosus]MDR7279776.1 hypothetical protein [Catenuloplanes atrovinosus]
MSAVTAVPLRDDYEGRPGRGGGRVPVLTGRPEPRGHRRPSDSPDRRAAAGWAIFFGLLGLGYRLLLVRAEVPPGDAAEAGAGLAALRIAQGQELPLFLDSERYMGSLQAFLAAPFVRVLGTGWWSVRLPALICFAGFLIVAYMLLRRLYTPWFAALSIGLFALGSDRVIRDELTGAGAYPEMLLAVTLLLLLTVRLAGAELKRPGLGLFGWGVLAGLMVWTHWWVLPFVAAAGVMLLLSFRRALVWLLVAAGTAAGAVPLIAYAVLGSPRSPFDRLVLASGNLIEAPLADRLTGTLFTAIPISGGLCAPGECVAWQAWWGPAYLALLLVALIAAIRGFGDAPPGRVPRHAGRLALILAAALTLAVFFVTANSALAPAVAAKNLHYTLIALPAVLWPLWRAAARLWGRRARTLVAAFTGLIGSAVLAAVLALAVAATAALILSGPAISAPAEDERELVAALDRAGATRVYSDRDTCDRITFITGERIICAVIDARLNQRGDRFPVHGTVVRAAPEPAWVLLAGSELDVAFTAFRDRTLRVFDVTPAGGYLIYQEDR